MSMDISAFYQTFFDEADELLADMEQHLLELDPLAPDIEPLNAIFRAAIRLKAGRPPSVLPSCRKPPICWKTCWTARGARK
ncbi:Chemotaxis protein CheA [Serratia rubidaea]|uniref:Chemotaxis protein CheA n=1 Tax=Serratia rubidaea TaxID=61652 RepID=A0A4U9HK14_SERRU|nr:Chemotaxis protein CheA [Serratia rubidaea]